MLRRAVGRQDGYYQTTLCLEASLKGCTSLHLMQVCQRRDSITPPSCLLNQSSARQRLCCCSARRCHCMGVSVSLKRCTAACTIMCQRRCSQLGLADNIVMPRPAGLTPCRLLCCKAAFTHCSCACCKASCGWLCSSSSSFLALHTSFLQHLAAANVPSLTLQWARCSGHTLFLSRQSAVLSCH